MGHRGFGMAVLTDSDQSSNTELSNKQQSQLSYITMKGCALVMFRSQAASVKFGLDLNSFSFDHRGLSRPRCHSAMHGRSAC